MLTEHYADVEHEVKKLAFVSMLIVKEAHLLAKQYNNESLYPSILQVLTALATKLDTNAIEATYKNQLIEREQEEKKRREMEDIARLVDEGKRNAIFNQVTGNWNGY